MIDRLSWKEEKQEGCVASSIDVMQEQNLLFSPGSGLICCEMHFL